MSLVLGLSVTTRDVRGELVDGATGQGEHLDRIVLDAADVEDYLATLPADEDLHAVGLTWTPDAESAAIKVREALDVYGGGARVVAVREVEATEALARGIAEMTGHDFLVVCIVEPDSAMVATVDGFSVEVEQIERMDAATLIDRVCAVVRSARPSPDVVFVLGSENADELVDALQQETDRPVVTATEADFALTRGAALASAYAASLPQPEPRAPRFTRVRLLTSALGVASVALVVSVSVVIGSQGLPEHSNRTTEPVAASAPIARPAPPAPSAETVRALAREPFALMNLPVAQAPPPPAAPVPVAPPPAPEPAAPANVSPAPPVYVPPAAPPPQPRLRDRILDKIPIIGRFR
ncbi:uncharacterized protein RMCC_4106 [Mycolicibacterium canariasense]|uniref:Uncharacterized protein n=1 Tax=Mycolicibacterium canariasense TaxID=228230 RepID=A0A117IB01_MYCCR|nr:hypothetical protein [Mycolicibacterium canariasense]MCV7211541.1 hypothetical protein [Mycolicibacterium canariasense]ORV08542.1 hypothetical protein AWB94_12455 [Mycolicibacterium canariasense]GAS97140.1 uncharacterized protein RMCC_4106 [Mycolicibacterium canariasense]